MQPGNCFGTFAIIIRIPENQARALPLSESVQHFDPLVRVGANAVSSDVILQLGIARHAPIIPAT